MHEGFSIFFSWQSDTPEEENKKFIRDCLDVAAKRVPAFSNIDEAQRVTAGIEGAAGTPEVASAIFEKISASSILVADVTLVGSGDISKKRRQPNPNVSIEMGYAAAALGWDRVVCVMNEKFGGRRELPFDHKNRRFPIAYSTSTGIEKDRAEFTETLVAALTAAEEQELRKINHAIRRLDVNALRLIADFGYEDHFSDPRGLGGGQYEMHYGPIFEAGIPRLLDLGLVFADAQPRQDLYAYHWTYLGGKVIKKLNFPKTDPGELFE